MNPHVSRRSLLAGGTAAVVFRGNRSTVAEQLRELEKTYAGRIGAWALDSATGARVSYRAGELFPLCSTFKALAAAAILRTARCHEPGLLDRVIPYPGDPGPGRTVRDLCAAAIEVSDNTAGNVLLERLGGPAGITRFARSLGDPVTRLDRTEPELNRWSPTDPRDTTTPAAVGRDLAALTVGHALVPDDRDLLIGWLRGCLTGGARIRAGLPATWTVGDKTGTGLTYGAANDIAIVWPRGLSERPPASAHQPPDAAPVILAVYTNHTDPAGTADNSVIARTASILAEALGKI
jgi:beta-lactamase class A